MAQVARGSTAAMTHIVTATRHVLLRRAQLLLFDRARAVEVVQDTYVAIWRSRHTYDPARPAWPWISRVLRSKCNSHWRRVLRNRSREEPIRPELDYGDCCPVLPSPYTDTVNAELCRIAWELLDELSPGIRDVLLLSLFRDLSDTQVADILEIPIGTVKSRKKRGLAHLRKRMNDHNEENSI